MRSVRILAVLVATAAAGCGASKGDVSGTVRFKEAPLPSGRIVFICEGGDRPVLTGTIKDGAYAFSGVPVGPVKVTLQTFEFKSTPVPNQPKDITPPGGGEAMAAGKYVPIPPRYGSAEGSGLTFHVTGGKQTQNFDLKP